MAFSETGVDIGGFTKKSDYDRLMANTVDNKDERILLSISFLAIQLTNYTSVDKPAIAAGGAVEINGVIYKNSIEVAISGATANTTWYDILLTPSGTTFTASFVVRETGVWSDSKQGLYDGNNRVIGCARRNTSDADWINKNILIVTNRTCKIKMETGGWNLDVNPFLDVFHGMSNYKKVKTVSAIIRNDADTSLFILYKVSDVADPNLLAGGIGDIDSNNITLIRRSGSIFDHTNYNDDTFNRGWITLEYEV